MSILVTGGMGYIGSHTVVCLIENGYDVVIIDNLSNSNIVVADRIKAITNTEVKLYQDDIMDAAALQKIFAENEIEAVIHFAAKKAVGESVEMPLYYYENNVCGTIELLKAMKNAGVNKLVYSSSACVYGDENIPPMTEDMPLKSINPYGWTKVMIEQILMDLCISDSNLSVVALRYFNPVGAHKSGLIGEDPSGIPANLPPYITQTLTGKREKLTVNGADYDTPDGTCIRDYIHVCDLADGHLSALKYMENSLGYCAVNLGRGHGESILSVVEAFEKAAGKKVPYIIGERRLGDAPISYAGVSKAEKLFGWSAKRDMQEMCKDAWNWQEKNPNGYK